MPLLTRKRLRLRIFELIAATPDFQGGSILSPKAVRLKDAIKNTEIIVTYILNGTVPSDTIQELLADLDRSPAGLSAAINSYSNFADKVEEGILTQSAAVLGDSADIVEKLHDQSLAGEVSATHNFSPVAGLDSATVGQAGGGVNAPAGEG
jgi:hypothetical protein